MLRKFVFLLFFPLFLTSCSRVDNREVVTFSSWGSITETKVINRAICDFEKTNPEIKINFIHIPQNYFQKLHLLYASNQAPDVVFINNFYLPVYETKLYDLSEYIKCDEFYSQAIDALSYNGKVLAVPRDVSNLVFYRNKTLVKTIPANITELDDVIKKVSPYGISYERDVYFMIPYILTYGEDVYHPNVSLEYYKNLEGHYAPTPAEIGSSTQAQMFLDGKIGLYLSGRWMYPKIKESANFEWDVILFPGVTSADASGWAISKDSKHKESALKFINFLSSQSTAEYFMSTGLIVPARKDVACNLDNSVFIEAIEKSKSISIEKKHKKLIDKMNKEFFK